MTLEERLDIKDVKAKLMNLQEYMPGQSEQTYDYAKYLGSKLECEELPYEFHITAQFALLHLRDALDYSTGKEINNSAVALPQQYYNAFLRNKIPLIAEAVCPKEFADGVKNFHKSMKFY